MISFCHVDIFFFLADSYLPNDSLVGSRRCQHVQRVSRAYKTIRETGNEGIVAADG